MDSDCMHSDDTDEDLRMETDMHAEVARGAGAPQPPSEVGDDEMEEADDGGNEGGPMYAGASPSDVDEARALEEGQEKHEAEAARQYRDNVGRINATYNAAPDGTVLNPPNSDNESSIGGGPSEPVFDGFDEKYFRAEGPSQPLLRPADEPWKMVTELGDKDCKPKRAMCVNIMADFWKRDAEFFKQMSMPKGHEARCKATAALVSLLFAGTAMGIPSGKHEEKMRDQANAEADDGSGKKKDAPLRRVGRYTYAPQENESDSYQMWQMALEEIFNHDQSEVIALRIWLLVYDETHSTSALMRKVMDEVKKLHDSQRAGAEAPTARSKAHSSETARRDKSNMGFETVGQDLEATAGMQYTRVQTMKNLYTMYDLHSGKTSTASGRPRYQHLHAAIDTPEGRRRMDGDFKTGCGGKHPLGPENMFNAKLREGLEYGLADMDGNHTDECSTQTDPQTYFDGNGFLQVPNLERPCFWVCTCPDLLTPFDMPLSRPLQGTVIPGENLLKCFAEKELRDKNGKAGVATSRVNWSDLVIDQGMTTRLRSLATKRDELQRKNDMLLANNLRTYDLMTAATSAAMGNSDISYNAEATGDEANYTIKTISMTTRVSREMDRIYEQVVAPWKAQRDKELTVVHAKLVAEGLDPDDTPDHERVKAYFRQRAVFSRRHCEIKKDLVQYLMRLMKTCFLSAKDAATVPAGYKVRSLF